MLEAREYSPRLGVITPEQLQAALDRFALGRLEDAAAAPGGLFGQIILLTTTHGEFALRGNPEAGQLAREHYAAQMIHEHTSVNVPWPYLVDETSEIFGWPYALMPRLSGEQLANRDVQDRLSPDDRIAIAIAMASYLAELHAAPFERCAEFDHEKGCYEHIRGDWASWFGDRTRWWLDRARAASANTTDADVAWVEEIIREARPSLAESFTPCLVHTDFKENNVVAERVDRGWRITGVFDLAETCIADGESDLARAYCAYARDERAEQFLRAYFDLRPPRPGVRSRLRHYVLHDRLIIWDHGQRNRIWFAPGMCLRDYAESYLELPSLRQADEPSR